MPKSLEPENLRLTINVGQFTFKNTNEISSETRFLEQSRALNALRFGAEIPNENFHLFAMGYKEVGMDEIIISALDQMNNDTKKIPSDWCYVADFDDPYRQKTLEFPAGLGVQFKKEIDELMNTLLYYFQRLFKENKFREKHKKNIKKTNTNFRKNFKKIRFKSEIYSKILKSDDFEMLFQNIILDQNMDKIKKKYSHLSNILNYLEDLKKDILSNISLFYNDFSHEKQIINKVQIKSRYFVNIIVDNAHLKKPPVIFEHHPSYLTLFGKSSISRKSKENANNINLIKSGSLHKANGGYLILEVHELLKEPNAWDHLKIAIKKKQISIENNEDPLFNPDPIPLNLKVILIGTRSNYYSFSRQDVDFEKLFKVRVDFNENMDLNNDNIILFIKYLAYFTQSEKLLGFNPDAVGYLIEFSIRLAENKLKLSVETEYIKELIYEANFIAKKHNKMFIEKIDVEQAIESKIKRANKSRDHFYENFKINRVLINVEGRKIGEINGLLVAYRGNFRFGYPIRISAKARAGSGDIVNIHREIKLSGSSHSKGVLVLTGFLLGKYNIYETLSLKATIVLEQIYEEIDGDSASGAELCALLSTLSNLPLRQDLAMTGSINQSGELQPIGAINEKIEGFFDVCKKLEFTSNQGIIIPSNNVQNLMLREDVIDAVSKGQFHIYPAETVEQAMSILTNKSIGERDERGYYPVDSINGLIELRLKDFTNRKKSS